VSTDAAVMQFEVRPEPGPGKKLLPDGVMGMVIFVFTEVMLFAGLISAHTIVRSRAAGEMWPPYGQPRLPLEETAINTAALLLSAVVIFFAQRAFRRGVGSARWTFLASIVLGIFFVASQGMEWAALLGEGLTMQSSAYGGFFYLIVGTHALHAVAAMLGMVWAWLRMSKGTLTQSQFSTVQVFWYFVVLVWPVLYWKVYL